MKKRVLLVTAVAAGILLTGCGRQSLSEAKIKENIPEGLKSVYVSNIDNDYGQTFVLNVDDVKIEKRQKDEKSDIIYCTVEASDENYRLITDCSLYSNYYDEGGWILDDYGVDSQEVKLLTGVPQELAETEINKFYFDTYEFEESDFNTESWNDRYVYNVHYKADNCHYDGMIDLSFTPNRYGNNVEWTPYIYYEQPFTWDVEGTWYSDLDKTNRNQFVRDKYAIEFNVNSVSYPDNTTVEMNMDVNEIMGAWNWGQYEYRTYGLAGSGSVEGFTDYSRYNYYSHRWASVSKDEDEQRLEMYNPPLLTFEMETEDNISYAVRIWSDEAAIDCGTIRYGDLYRE